MNSLAAPALSALLREGAAALGLELDEGQVQRLLAYQALLLKWGRAFNLTAVREPQRVLTHHLLDCLALAPYLHGRSLLDVGTGAGLPGLVLAIARPQVRCVLLDSNGKKTRFCVQGAAELGLENVVVVQERVQRYRPRSRFESVSARAFSALPALLRSAAHTVAPGGRILAMRGTLAGEQARQVADLGECAKVVPLAVPGLEAQRHLVIVDPMCVQGLSGTRLEDEADG